MATCKRAESADSAPRSIAGAAVIAICAQAARSNIQAGSSSQRPAVWPSTLQRKTSPPPFAITSWIATARPNQGCQAYRTSRTSVPWAFRRCVVQRRASTLGARQQDPGGVQSPAHGRCGQPRQRPKLHPRTLLLIGGKEGLRSLSAREAISYSLVLSLLKGSITVDAPLNGMTRAARSGRAVHCGRLAAWCCRGLHRAASIESLSMA